MKQEDFELAQRIISIDNQQRIKVSYNTPVSDNYGTVYKILIHESNATVISKLIDAGFSLSMNPKGLDVSKY